MEMSRWNRRGNHRSGESKRFREESRSGGVAFVLCGIQSCGCSCFPLRFVAAGVSRWHRHSTPLTVVLRLRDCFLVLLFCCEPQQTYLSLMTTSPFSALLSGRPTAGVSCDSAHSAGRGSKTCVAHVNILRTRERAGLLLIAFIS